MIVEKAEKSDIPDIDKKKCAGGTGRARARSNRPEARLDTRNSVERDPNWALAGAQTFRARWGARAPRGHSRAGEGARAQGGRGRSSGWSPRVGLGLGGSIRGGGMGGARGSIRRGGSRVERGSFREITGKTKLGAPQREGTLSSRGFLRTCIAPCTLGSGWSFDGFFPLSELVLAVSVFPPSPFPPSPAGSRFPSPLLLSPRPVRLVFRPGTSFPPISRWASLCT